MEFTDIKKSAEPILDVIKKSKSILLCCHPSPDPDSVGSNLAMKFVLEGLGKKVTVIKGDSDIPQAFMHFLGANSILQNSFIDVDLKKFDLFIILDAPSLDRVTRLAPVGVLPGLIPRDMKVVMIDHHQPRSIKTDISLIDTTSPATCQILFDLFKEWGIDINENIASNLFIGIYTDTGGFKYKGATPHTFEIATKLVSLISNTSDLISKMENTEIPATIAFYGKAFSSVQTFLNDHLAISSVSYNDLVSIGIADIGMRVSGISSMLRVVSQWYVVASLVEIEPNKVKCSFRSKDAEKYSVATLCEALGGGGHKMAAGVYLSMPLEEAKKLIVSKAKDMYNL